MPNEYVHEEPLDEEEGQLAKELEAGEWVSSPTFVVTDECEETVSALETTANELERAKADPYRWKWVILALHSALQGMMVLALRGGNNLRVLKTEDAKRFLDAYENGMPIPANLQMDDFPNLYKKVKSEAMLFYGHSEKFTPQGTQSRSIKRLNRLRNQFMHFTPCTFMLGLKELPEMTLDCLAIADFLAWHSNNVDWDGKDKGAGLVERTKEAFRVATKAAQEIKEAFALSSQL